MWPFRKKRPAGPPPIMNWNDSPEAKILGKLTFDELVAVRPYLASDVWWPGIQHWRAMKAATEEQAKANAAACAVQRYSRDDRVDAFLYAASALHRWKPALTTVYDWFLPEEGRHGRS